jgi:hypothetical protein
MKKYNLIQDGEILATFSSKKEAENSIEDTKINDQRVADTLEIKSKEMDVMEALNQIKSVIEQVVNKICRANFDSKRRIEGRYGKDLKISEINEEDFYFEMGKDFYEDELGNNEYALYGNYVKKENAEGIRAWFKAKPRGKNYQVKYEILINFDENKVNIEADAQEESFSEVTFPEIKIEM